MAEAVFTSDLEALSFMIINGHDSDAVVLRTERRHGKVITFPCDRMQKIFGEAR